MDRKRDKVYIFVLLWFLMDLKKFFKVSFFVIIGGVAGYFASLFVLFLLLPLIIVLIFKNSSTFEPILDIVIPILMILFMLVGGFFGGRYSYKHR